MASTKTKAGYRATDERQAPTNGAKPREEGHEYMEVYTFSFVLAEAATGTIRAAAGADRKLRKDMEREGLIDAAFLHFEEDPPSAETLKWIKRNFGNSGRATVAVERQLETILRKHFMEMLMSRAPPCWPFCGDGYHNY